MSRFGFIRPREDVMSDLDVTTSQMQATPTAGGTLFEIGVVLALHLAFAFAIVLTLRSFGLS